MRSRIPDVVLPESVGSLADGEEWADHIEDAADQLDVERATSRVRRIERAGSGWNIVTSTGDIDAGVVVVATGRNRLPEIPDWPGLDTTTIEVLHAADYQTPARFVGRRVLVVGAGNSGTEIAHLLRSAGVDVTLSMRTRPVWARTRAVREQPHRLRACGKASPRPGSST